MQIPRQDGVFLAGLLSAKARALHGIVVAALITCQVNVYTVKGVRNPTVLVGPKPILTVP